MSKQEQLPNYSIRFDALRRHYVASNGTIGVHIRPTIGLALIQKVSHELGNPVDDEGQKRINTLAAQRVFEYIQTFT